MQAHAPTTLTTAPLAPLLDRLFTLADASAEDANPIWDAFPADRLDQLMRSKTEYAGFYDRLKDLPLAVSLETGRLLYMLARGCGARSIVEYGTSFGISTLHLAAALRDNGGGRLVTCEFEPSKVLRARQNLVEGGVMDLVEIREGDALQKLRAGLPDTVDLLLLAGAKSLYPEILDLVEPRLRLGAFVIADNAEYSPEYLARIHPRKRLSVRPVRRGRRAVDAARLTAAWVENSDEHDRQHHPRHRRNQRHWPRSRRSPP